MIVDVDVHATLTGSLDDFAPLAALAERFDAVFGVCSLRAAGRPGYQRPPSAAYARALNDQTRQLMERYPARVFGLCNVNPLTEQTAYDELERRLTHDGFSGLKLLPAVSCDDPRVDPLIEICQRHGVPALVHNWHKAVDAGPGESDPLAVAALAARHPRATSVALRAGGDYEYGAKALRPFGNVLLEIGGSDCRAGMVETLAHHVGAERVLFGTDMPGRSFTSQLAKVLAAALPDAAKEAILGGNAARILPARAMRPAPRAGR